jgi:hypothetical protein
MGIIIASARVGIAVSTKNHSPPDSPLGKLCPPSNPSPVWKPKIAEGIKHKKYSASKTNAALTKFITFEISPFFK